MSYQVMPDYCTGDNERYDITGPDLKSLLRDELEHQYRDQIPDRATLGDLLALGAKETDGRITFDVTRQGCSQSTLRVRAD